MAEPDINSLTDKLASATVDTTSLLSFAGKSYRLDKEHQDAVDEVVEGIKTFPQNSLKSLNLEGNTLGVDAAKCIRDALKDRPEFQRALWSDMFTGRLKSEIPDALRFLAEGVMTSGAQLVELDLSDNAFGPNGMKGLQEFLKSKSVYTLKILSLNNNGLGPTGGTMLANCLMESYKKSKETSNPMTLTKFVSGRGRLEDEGARLLAEVFKVMGSLEEVSMPQNGIRADGIMALAKGLAANPNLHSINLNDNTFTEKGANAMAKALPQLQKLRVINFGDCLIRTKGMIAIAEAIKDDHQELEQLMLGFNEVKVEGAEALIDAINNKDNLEKLDLNGNAFGEGGVQEVKELVKAVGKEEIFESLSDDEGSSDEEGDSTEEGEDEEEDEEEKPAAKNKEQAKQDSLGVKSSPSIDVKKDEPVTVDSFLKFPSARKLQQLGPHRAEDIFQTLGNTAEENYTDKAMALVMKVCSVVTPGDDKTKAVACECAAMILERTLAQPEENVVNLVTNSILVSLGLIKSEDKKYKPPNDITGALIVLEYLVQQSFFPKSAKDMLQIFIGNKGGPLLNATEGSRAATHKLLQALVI